MFRWNDMQIPNFGLPILGVFLLLFAVNSSLAFAIFFFCAVTGSSVFLKRRLRRFFQHPNTLQENKTTRFSSLNDFSERRHRPAV